MLRPPEAAPILAPLAAEFTSPAAARVHALTAAAMLTTGRRTVLGCAEVVRHFWAGWGRACGSAFAAVAGHVAAVGGSKGVQASGRRAGGAGGGRWAVTNSERGGVVLTDVLGTVI